MLDIRNFGPMGGVELAPSRAHRGRAPEPSSCFEAGVVIRNGGDILQFALPRFDARRARRIFETVRQALHAVRKPKTKTRETTDEHDRSLHQRHSTPMTTAPSRCSTRLASRCARWRWPATVEQAIAAAEAAFPAWRKTPPPLKRARILFAYKALLDKHAERIVAAIVEEHGKVWEDAHGELQRIEVVEYACGAPEFLKGEHSRDVGPEIDSWSEVSAARRGRRHHPVQLPVDGPDVDVPMAIACGNCFILKPSEKDPRRR